MAVAEDLRPVRNGPELIRNQPRPLDPRQWLAFADWDPAKHPRGPGGRFISAKELLEAAKKFAALPDKEDEYRARDLHAEGEWSPKGKSRSAYGAVVFNDKGQVLVREPTNHFGGYHWTIGGKGGQDGDEHPVDTAKREVLEETGQKIQIVGHVPGGHTYGSVHQWLEYPHAPAPAQPKLAPTSSGRRLITDFGGHPASADFKPGDTVEHWKYGSGTVVATTKSKVVVRKGWNVHFDDPAELRHHPSMWQGASASAVHKYQPGERVIDQRPDGYKGTGKVIKWNPTQKNLTVHFPDDKVTASVKPEHLRPAKAGKANDLVAEVTPSEPAPPPATERVAGPPKVHVSDTTQNTNYYLARTVGEDPDAMDWETSQTRWVDPEEAADLLSESPYPEGRQRMLDTLNSAYNEYRRLTGLEATPDASVGGQVTEGGGTGAAEMAEWEEALHPRAPKGTPHAGEFIKKVGFGGLLGKLFKDGDEVYALDNKTGKLEKKVIKTPAKSVAEKYPGFVQFKGEATVKSAKYVAHPGYVDSLTKEEHLAKAAEEEAKPKPDVKLVAAHKAAAELTTKVSAPKAAEGHVGFGTTDAKKFQPGDEVYILDKDGKIAPETVKPPGKKIAQSYPNFVQFKNTVKNSKYVGHQDVIDSTSAEEHQANATAELAKDKPDPKLVALHNQAAELAKQKQAIPTTPPPEAAPEEKKLVTAYSMHTKPTDFAPGDPVLIKGQFHKPDHHATVVGPGPSMPLTDTVTVTHGDDAPAELQGKTTNQWVSQVKHDLSPPAAPAEAPAPEAPFKVGDKVVTDYGTGEISEVDPANNMVKVHYTAGDHAGEEYWNFPEDVTKPPEPLPAEELMQGLDQTLGVGPSLVTEEGKGTGADFEIGDHVQLPLIGATKLTVHDKTPGGQLLLHDEESGDDLENLDPSLVIHDPAHEAENLANHGQAPAPAEHKVITEYGAGTAADFMPGDKVTTYLAGGVDGTVAGPPDPDGQIPVALPVGEGQTHTIALSPEVLIHSQPEQKTPGGFKVGDTVIDSSGDIGIVQGPENEDGTTPVSYPGLGITAPINIHTSNLQHAPEGTPTPAAPAPATLVTDYGQGALADFAPGDEVLYQGTGAKCTVLGAGDNGRVRVTNHDVDMDVDILPGQLKHDPDHETENLANHAAPAPAAPEPPKLITDFNQAAGPEDFKPGDHVKDQLGDEWTVQPPETSDMAGYVPVVSSEGVEQDIHPGNLIHDPGFEAENLANHGLSAPAAPAAAPLPGGFFVGDKVHTQGGFTYTVLGPGDQPGTLHIKSDADGLEYQHAAPNVFQGIATGVTPATPPAAAAPAPPEIKLINQPDQGAQADFLPGDKVIDTLTGIKSTVVGPGPESTEVSIHNDDEFGVTGSVGAGTLIHDPDFETENVANHFATAAAPAAPAPTAATAAAPAAPAALKSGDWIVTADGAKGVITQPSPDPDASVKAIVNGAMTYVDPATLTVDTAESKHGFAVGDKVISAGQPNMSGTITSLDPGLQVHWETSATGAPMDVTQTVWSPSAMINLTHPPLPQTPAKTYYQSSIGAYKPGEKITYKHGSYWNDSGIVVSKTSKTVKIKLDDGTVKNVKPSSIKHMSGTWAPAAPSATTAAPGHTPTAGYVGYHPAAPHVTPTPAPSPPPAAPVEKLPGSYDDLKSWPKINGPHGSNPGDWYQAPDGTKVYAKPMSAAKAYNEVGGLAAYEAAGFKPGVDFPYVKAVQGEGGKTYVLSQMMPDALKTPNAGWWNGHPAARQEAAKLTAINALVSHYDAAGSEYDNLLIGPGDKPVLIEAGGSMAYRARGEPKATWSVGSSLLDEIKSVTGKHPDHPNAPMRAVFGQQSDMEIAAQLDQIAKDPEYVNRLDDIWKAQGMPEAQRVENRAVIEDRIKQIPDVVKTLAPQGLEYGQGTALGVQSVNPWKDWVPPTPAEEAAQAVAAPFHTDVEPMGVTSEGELHYVETRLNGSIPDTYEAVTALEKTTGPDLGAIKGDYYKDAEGHVYNVQKAKSLEIAQNQVASNIAYAVAGGQPGQTLAPTRVLQGPDGAYIVQQIPQGADVKTASWWSAHPVAKESISNQWAMDALLSNWNVAGGSSLNKVIVGENELPIRINTGGAMRFRQQGEVRANWTPTGSWTEPWTMRGKNYLGQSGDPGAATVFGGISDDAAADQLEALQGLNLDYLESAWKAAGVPDSQIEQNLAVIQARLAKLPEVVTKLRKHEDVSGGHAPTGIGQYEAVPSELVSGPPTPVAPKSDWIGPASKLNSHQTLSPSMGEHVALLLTTLNGSGGWTGSSGAWRASVLHGHPKPGATAIYQAVDAAPSNAPVLYRGFGPGWSLAKVNEVFAPGKTVNMNIMSTSESKAKAKQFAGGQLLFHIPAGSRALRLGVHGYHHGSESEWISQGQFIVDHVAVEHDGLQAHVYLKKQLATFQLPPVPEMITVSEGLAL